MLKKGKSEQFDLGLLKQPCRNAKDINSAVGIPAEVLASLARHQISLEEAVFYMRTEQYDCLHMHKRSRDCLERFLKAENFFRDDFTVANFGYVRLMREIGLETSAIGKLDEITSNEMYETCVVVSKKEIEKVDLMLDNRLSARGQKILRGKYGLDGKVYTTREIAESFNYVDEELTKKFPKAARIKAWSDSREERVLINMRKSMAKMTEKRDDRREFSRYL